MDGKFNGQFLLADDMGLGKTPQYLAWLNKHPEVEKVLIVCEAGLKWHWQQEAWKHFRMESVVLESRDADPDFADRRITIINYDIIKDWVEVLKTKQYDAMCMDECHILANPETKWFKACKEVSLDVPYKAGLSGTPITHKHADVWSICNIIRPDKFSSRFAFGIKFCNVRKDRGKWVYKGSPNGETLHRLLRKTLMIRRTKQEVLKDLPPKTRYVVPIDIDNRDEYNLACKDFRKWLKTYSPEKASSRQKAIGRAQLGYLIRIAGRGKLSNVNAWVNNFFADTEEKLILFGINRFVLNGVENKFRRCSVLVNGSVTGKKRQSLFDKFNQDNSCRLFLGNIRAASQGWSAKACSNVAFCQFAWKPGAHVQGEDRCSGIKRGQKGVPLSIYYIAAHGTVEETMAELLQRKAKIIDTALDGGKGYQDFNVYDTLLEELKERWF